MLRVDIGCGETKPPGFIGVDICPGPGVDIVADISKVFPFHDSAVDELRAFDVIEHLPDRLNTMNEIWRVCRAGAQVEIFVPSTDGRGAFQDPTHVSFWNLNSFYYFCVDFPGYYELCRKYGFKGAFRLLALQNEDSGSGVMHVRARLEVVKPPPALGRSPALPQTQHSFPPITPVSTSDRPFWSVMLPVYNPNAAYFEATLQALLAQAPEPEAMQIEVVDDASTTVDVAALIRQVEQQVAQPGRVQYYRQPHNLGLIDNWNACLERATGHWVHLLHQDDLVLPGFYAALRSPLTLQPELGAAFCRHFHIDAVGDRRYLSLLERETAGVLEGWVERLAVQQQTQFAATVVKRSTYETLGGFYAEARSAADWEMWQRIAVHYPIWFEPQPLACYRLHSSSESSRLIRLGENVADARRVIEIAQSYLPQAIAPVLQPQALEHYANSALRTARLRLQQGDLAAALAQLHEGLKCSQSEEIKAQLVQLLLDCQPQLLIDPPLNNLAQQVAQLQQGNPTPEIIAQLQQARATLAQQLLETPPTALKIAYQGSLGTAHQLLLQARQTHADWDQTEGDRRLPKPLAPSLEAPEEINELLAAMLYHYPHQLQLEPDLLAVPEWLQQTYLQFLWTPPPLLLHIGEAEQYRRYLQRLLAYLHQRILEAPDSPLWQAVAIAAADRLNMILLYFTEANLRELYAQRAAIMEFALRCQGYALDYTFPARSPDRNKLRLGILAAHFTPQSETFATLPSYQHLDRETFEIILFSGLQQQHRLESYCAGHADQFVLLPQTLAEQVETIRQTDLDLLLIATNVTAVTNGIARLAAHRLARVQLLNVCSCVTSGFRNIDYFISGSFSGPQDDDENTEAIVRIQGPAHCYNFATERSLRPTAAISREQLGIAPAEVVYISGSNFFKITPEVEALWVEILENVPSSRLILYPFNPNWANRYPEMAFRHRLKQRLEAQGVSSDRLILLEATPSAGDVLERLKLGDIYLDTFPFAGVTSLLDPLMVGLPAVTMDGPTFRARMGSALLQELACSELIAASPAEYLKQAITLGTDAGLRSQWRDRIQQAMQQRPRFLDSELHSAQMQQVFQQVWRQYQQQQYRLRSINLLAFPDWQQPEAELLETLVDLLRAVVLDPNCEQTALLIGLRHVDPQEADAAIATALFYLVSEAEMNPEAHQPEIVLLGVEDAPWSDLVPLVKARVVLPTEDAVAIALAQASHLPQRSLA